VIIEYGSWSQFGSFGEKTNLPIPSSACSTCSATTQVWLLTKFGI
jgi:hypothetical protein